MYVYLTDSAKNKLISMEKEGEKKAKFIRIFLERISAWYGPMIKVLLEKPKDTDIKEEISGIDIFMDKNLEEQIEGLYIHYIENQYYTGFKVESQLKE